MIYGKDVKLMWGNNGYFSFLNAFIPFVCGGIALIVLLYSVLTQPIIPFFKSTGLGWIGIMAILTFQIWFFNMPANTNENSKVLAQHITHGIFYAISLGIAYTIVNQIVANL